MLTLGIGANTAIFSVVNAAVLHPLPYPNADRLAILWGNVKRVRVERRGASYPDYCDWRDRSRLFSGMAAFEDAQFALTGVGAPEQLPGESMESCPTAFRGGSGRLGFAWRWAPLVVKCSGWWLEPEWRWSLLESSWELPPLWR